LNIRIHFFFFFATAAKIDDAAVGFPRFTQEDILGLEITVDDPLVLEQNQACEQLP